MIAFEAFKNLASQMAADNQTETHAIGVDEHAGKLAAYSVSVKVPDKTERAAFERVRRELTDALSNEVGVKAESLPKDIRELLSGITTRSRLTAGDVTRLADALERLQTAREQAVAAFCERADRVSDAIGKALADCGCEGASLPARAPLTNAFTRAFDAAVADMKRVTDADDLQAQTQALADRFEKNLQKIFNEAFGTDGTSGPLSARLRAAAEGVQAGPAQKTEALEREMMDYRTDAMYAEDALPDLDPASTRPADRAAMAKYQLNVFNKRIGTLLGDDARTLGNRISTGVPLGGAIARTLDAVLKDKKASVGEIRQRFETIMEQVLGTEDEPTELAQELSEIGRGENGWQVATNRLRARKALMMAKVNPNDQPSERLALLSVCNLALTDFKVYTARGLAENAQSVENDDDFVFDEDRDPVLDLAGDPETPRRIAWILSARSDDLDILRDLTQLILKGDAASIKLLDQQLGDQYVDDERMNLTLSAVSPRQLLGVMAEQKSPLLDDPNFLLYMEQRTGSLPLDMQNGQDVLRIGFWSENPNYRPELARITRYVEELKMPLMGGYPASDPHMQVTGAREPAQARYVKSVADFRNAFNLKSDGSFKTVPLKTKGQLYFDAKTGAVKSANRHFGHTVPSTPAENYRLRLSIVDAFRREGASEAFLKKARRALALGTNAQGEPVSRQVVKSLIIEFDALASKTTQQTRREPPKIEQPRSPIVPPKVEQPKTKVEQPKTKVEPPKTKIEQPKPQVEPPKPKVEQPPIRNVPQPNVPVHNGPKVLRAPKDADVEHPVSYDNLYLHPQSLVRRQLLFLAPNRFKLCAPFTALDPNDAASVWLAKIMESNTTKAPFVRDGLAQTLRELPPMRGHDIDQNILLAHLEEALEQTADLQADATDDVRLTAIAQRLADRVFAAPPRAATAQEVGMMKYALVAATATLLRSSGVTGRVLAQNIVDQGGGLVHADSWVFRENGQDYRSSIMPRTDVEARFHVANTRTIHLTGLSRSELADVDGHPQMAFLRFGECVSFAHPNEAQHLLQELAEQTFLNNDRLVAQAKNGDTIDLPIVRTDLGGLEGLQGNGAPFRLTFTPQGKTQPVTVTIRPHVEHFCLPTDSLKTTNGGLSEARTEALDGRSNVLLDRTEMQLNRQAWASLKARALNALQGPHGAAVRLLVDQIDAYFRTALAGDEVLAFPNFGAELTRLGARIGVLASLLGDVPSVNCNWGRDRTGAMDNELKLTRLVLDADPAQLPPIRLAPGTQDPLREQRTRMLDTTGNRQIAHQTNCSMYDLNLHQFIGSFRVGDVRYEGSGLDTLFDVRNLPPFSQRIQDLARESVALADEQGRVRTAAQICDLLLPGTRHRIQDNRGNGDCFFYAALDQMSNRDTVSFPSVDTFRTAFADYLAQKRDEMDRGQLQGLKQVDEAFYVTTTQGMHPVQHAFDPLRGGTSFRTGHAMADVSHGAFLADMLKRPVVIISRNAMASGATKTVFDCDLTTGRPFDRQDPVVIYYEQAHDSEGIPLDAGHFQAVLTA